MTDVVRPSLPASSEVAPRQRLRLIIRGLVQGVGFRPWVYRLATSLGLTGWVRNDTSQVVVEVEGPTSALEALLVRLPQEAPSPSHIHSLEPKWLVAEGLAGFEIRESETVASPATLVPADIATCAECVREIFDPQDRRFGYPFTNCTHCGPRFSLIESLPYDRARTSMKGFPLCPACQAEYEDPDNRRFHAQPIACPRCGPQLALWDARGREQATATNALQGTVAALRAGQIVAVKGLGGFQLLVAANHETAIQRLRERKHRGEKPFAVLFPDLTTVRLVCGIEALEERLLRSSEAPIVLLERHASQGLDPNSRRADLVSATVAPGNPLLGAMLPYTPLHHLLMHALGAPVVCTSGNRSDEPICIDEHEALERLGGITDRFLVHNRPILRPVDDSIVRVVLGREMVLRRARGYAPLPVHLRAQSVGPVVLAVGAHFKNTVALGVGDEVFLSQHLGDLDTEPARAAFRRALVDLPQLFAARPERIASDAHPDYVSTQEAQRFGLPNISVQHHFAHALAVLAENELEPPVLAITWDGTGWGSDGTIWGGEFLVIHAHGFDRFAALRPFRLPGGDVAAREPRRSALGLLWDALGEDLWQRSDLAPLEAFRPAERSVLRRQLERSVNAPLTSSAGRLFDGFASLLGLRQISHFEGQAAMDVEFAAMRSGSGLGEPFPFELTPGIPAAESSSVQYWLDWRPMVRAALEARAHGVSAEDLAARFHATLVAGAQAIVRHAGFPRIALSGGCFQNALLTRTMVQQLKREHIQVFGHQRVPPNDGGIALGQVLAARLASR